MPPKVTKTAKTVGTAKKVVGSKPNDTKTPTQKSKTPLSSAKKVSSNPAVKKTPLIVSKKKVVSNSTTKKDKLEDSNPAPSEAATVVTSTCEETLKCEAHAPEGAADETVRKVCDDPWLDLTIEEQWKRIRAGDVTVVSIDASSVKDGSIEKAELSTIGNESVFGMQIEDGGVTTLNCGETLQSRLLVLNLPNNIDLGQAFFAGKGAPLCSLPFAPLWLRELSLSACNLSEFPDLRGLECLLKLDISFNSDAVQQLCSVEAAPNVTPIIAALRNVRWLDLDSCDVETVEEGCALSQWTSLSVLSLQDNELDDVDAIAGLATLGGSLSDLSLDGNAVCNKGNFKSKVAALLPALTRLNHDGVDRGDVKAKRWDEVANLQQDIQNAHLFDANVDNSSCSCLEGNACTQPDHCSDWKNRFEVAKKVRETNQFNHGSAF